jgi:hypothetical protein
MQIDDLYLYPEGYPPTPYGQHGVDMEKDDKWGYGTLPPGLQLLPIGWLGSQVPTKGPVPEHVIDFLFNAYKDGSFRTAPVAGIAVKYALPTAIFP